MNYISLINNFWEKYKFSPVSSGGVALFFAILNQANQRRWSFPVHMTNTFLQSQIHISRSAFYKYRQELADNGYITFFAINSLVGSGYNLSISDKKGTVKSGTDLKTLCTNPKTDLKTELKTDLKTNLETENELSSYNNKTKKEDINKDFKEKRFYNKKYNDKEIYDSGRYDFEKIERIARKRLREELEKIRSSNS